MYSIPLADLDRNLAADIAGSSCTDWLAYSVDYPAATVSNQCYHVVFSADALRGGIVFCGSGSSGMTAWTDASSPDDVLQRFYYDDMSN